MPKIPGENTVHAIDWVTESKACVLPYRHSIGQSVYGPIYIFYLQ